MGKRGESMSPDYKTSDYKRDRGTESGEYTNKKQRVFGAARLTSDSTHTTPEAKDDRGDSESFEERRERRAKKPTTHSKSHKPSKYSRKEKTGDNECCNKKSHEENDNKEKKEVENTEEGHLIYQRHDVLSKRYEIIKDLGEGTFGKVVQCKDYESGEKVAVKIIRNVAKYRDAAKIEIDILKKISEGESLEGCVEMLHSFNHHGHICIVFETLGKSVFDFLKDNGYCPFPIIHVKAIGEQLLHSLKFLHGLKYTHTDLKPENILFSDSDYETVYDKHLGLNMRFVRDPAIKVIDFGSATHEKEHHSRVVSTRHYRAPEVIAEIGWSYPCDLWSVGCILFECYTGHTLFQTHDNKEHLAMMEFMLGTLPAWICKTSKKRYFRKDRLDFNKHSSSGRYIRKYCRHLSEYRKESSYEHQDFFDLLKGLLEYDPERRLSASSALKHQFFDHRTSRSHKSR